MIRPSKFFQFYLLIVSVFFLEGGFAQNYTRWELHEGAKMRLGKGEITCKIAYSPDGTRLAVASSIGVWLYDANTGAEVSLLTGHSEEVYAVAFSPDGSVLASGGNRDAIIRLCDLRTAKATHALVGHHGAVTSVASSPDGARLASGGSDDTIRIWDANTEERLWTLEGHTGGWVP
ncbi:MAG: hypothetical protein OXN17_03270 [Candidatus Poribacteria bacterium]|nr:hypothetical protein [Candidatus Poribacteria bacterium]MDE0506119.1 hypothetical protein [Candidatus Poribacteria bacterium]